MGRAWAGQIQQAYGKKGKRKKLGFWRLSGFSLFAHEKNMEGGELLLPEWEYVDQEELEAIEAAFSIATASIKRNSPPDDDQDPPKTRRLPSWGTISSRKQAFIAVSGAGSKSSPTLADTRLQNSVEVERSSKSAEISSPRNGFWNLVPSSCEVNPKFKYPKMNYDGHIVYGRTSLEVEKATVELLEIIKAMKQNMDQISLGLDIEWRPTFRRGESPRKAAVMQICVDNTHCYVFHIIHSGIPPVLQALLEDSTSVKVGVCIANDAVKVSNDYNVQIKTLKDLSGLANLKLGGVTRRWSLSSLTEMLISKELEKPNKIRMGNWERDVLSKEQLQYAATDAFASWYLYQVLNSFPDASESSNNEEK